MHSNRGLLVQTESGFLVSKTIFSSPCVSVAHLEEITAKLKRKALSERNLSPFSLCTETSALSLTHSVRDAHLWARSPSPPFDEMTIYAHGNHEMRPSAHLLIGQFKRKRLDCWLNHYNRWKALLLTNRLMSTVDIVCASSF